MCGCVCVCVQFTLFPMYRYVSVMVTTLVMTAAGVNLGIMEMIVVNHRFSLDGQLPLTLMRSGWSLLKFFKCCAHMILTIPFSWRNLFLATQASQHQMSPSTNCTCGYITLLPGIPLAQVSYSPTTICTILNILSVQLQYRSPGSCLFPINDF